MKTVRMPSGELVPALGQGTWRMGEDPALRGQEIATLRAGLDMGMRLIDTAEMYGEGGAETVVGEAIAGRRDGVFLVSKVYPHNASAKGAIAACERSLQRLGTDRLDLYLLHWKGAVPLAETVAAFERLKAAGKIRHWGVSNLDPKDMRALAAVTDGGSCVANQVLYNLKTRGIEWELLPDHQKRAIAVMAYTPLGQGTVLGKAAVQSVAEKHGVAPAAAALAWVLRQPGIIAIPKASRLEHVRANAAAAELQLDAEDLAALDKAFPPPKGPTALAML